MRFWLISVLGICTFFVVAIVWGFSTSTQVVVGTRNDVSTVFSTASSTAEILPHGSLLVMLVGSLLLAIIPVVHELSNGLGFKSKEETPNFGFSLTQDRGVDLGVSKRELAEIGKITKKVVRELKQTVEEKQYNNK